MFKNMKVLWFSRKEKKLRIIPEDPEDLWLIGSFLERGDRVRGVIERRVKREDERGSGRVVRFRGTIEVEDAEVRGSHLKVKGILLEGPEDVTGRGKHQSITILPGQEIEIEKNEWNETFLEYAKEYEEESRLPPVTLILISDEEALVSEYKRRLGPVKRIRRGSEDSLRPFLGEVVKEMGELNIVGGPKIILDEVKQLIPKDKKVYFVVTPLEGEKGLRDIIGKRAPKILEALRRQKVESIIDEFLMHLSKEDGLASLHPTEDIGNLKVLLVHEEKVKDALTLLREVKDSGGDVYIVKDDFQGSEIIKKLGGMVGIRFYAV